MSGMMLAFAGGSYGAAPVNTVAPVVSGTATVGQTLSTTNGTWTGAPAPTFTYQWQRVTTNISGATSSTYVLVDADGGSTVRCVVKATNTIAPAGVTANSNSTAAVAAIVPGAPTIGTATATGSSTATVAYTAPASNGGATITLYTATSSPGGLTGTLATAGSGTITVSGLTALTSYTFTVTATNSAGTSAASAASNSITTTAKSMWITTVTASQFSRFSMSGYSQLVLDTSNNVYIGGEGRLSSNTYFAALQLTANGATNGGAYVTYSTATYSSIEPRDVARDSSGNIYIGGKLFNSSRGGTDGVLIKYNSSFALQSQQNVLQDNSSASALYSDGTNLFVAGAGRSVAKFDSGLNLQSGTGNSDVQWNNVRTDSSGNIYVFGSGYRAPDQTAVVFKYNSSFTLQWQREGYIGSSNYKGYGGAVDSSGNVAMVASGGASGGTLQVLYYNSSGTIQWQQRLSASPTQTQAINCDFDSSGNLYVLGTATNNNNILVAKYNSSGTIQFQRTITSTSNATGIRVSSAGIFVVGNDSLILFVAKLPLDGSGTGTYGSYTYAASSLTASSTGMTTATPTYTSSSNVFSNYGSQSPAGTSASLTLTGTVVL